MRPYYAPGYSGHNSIKTIMLTGGRQKHTMEGWLGYSNPNEGLDKVKWINLNRPVSEEWKFEASERSQKSGFTQWIVQSINGKLVCDCGGYRFQRQCKHTTKVENGDF